MYVLWFLKNNGVPSVSDGGGGISKGNGCFGHLTALLDDPMTSSLSPSANFQPASVIFSSSYLKKSQNEDIIFIEKPKK